MDNFTMSGKQKLIPPPASVDLLMHSLKHHAPDNSDPNVYVACKNPFEEINANEELAKAQQVLDYDSEPDSDTEDALYETQWGDQDQELADVQHMDEEMEYGDIVDRTDVYTEDEILKLSIEKAAKLHTLYSNQLTQLRQMYIERKRQYLQELKKEKELYCSIHKQKKTSLEEMKKYTQLKCLLAYGRKHRLDAILAKREHEKKIASATRAASKAKKTYTCGFQDDGVRCFNTCIPLTKFCIRHILMDKRQVLFRPCDAPFNNTTCNNPVLVISKDDYCMFHSTYKTTLEREQKEQAAVEMGRLEKERLEKQAADNARLEEMKEEMKDLISISFVDKTEDGEEKKEFLEDIDVEIDVEKTPEKMSDEKTFREEALSENKNEIKEEEEKVEETQVVEENQVIEEQIEYEENIEETVQEEVIDDQIVEIE